MEEKQTESFVRKRLQPYGKRFVRALLPVFALAFTLVFFGTLDILNSNRYYMTFAPSKLVGPCILATLGGTVVLAALAALARGRAFGAVTAFFAVVTVAMYLQGMFLNGDIGTLDGTSYVLSEHVGRCVVSAVVWAALLAGGIVCALRWPEECRTGCVIACAAVILAQGVSLATTWSSEGVTENYQLSGENQFVLSANSNLVILTLDQFSPYLMDEQLESDPTLYELFGDFTYYDNMSSNYSYTFPSMCCLLTHQHMTYDIPTLEYISNAWHSEQCESFYDTLHSLGYEVRLYAETNYVAADAVNMLGKIDNVVSAGSLQHKGTLLWRAMGMSVYRYLPNALKNVISTNTEWVNMAVSYENVESMAINYDFLPRLRSDGMTIGESENTAVWYHLQGAHFPYVVDYDGEFVGEDETSRPDQLHGYLMTLQYYFDCMKELGIYDDATIIISADHGYVECYQAAFLIKPAGQTGDTLEIRHAPVAQDDIWATILDVLGQDYEDYGRSVYDVAEDEERERSSYIWAYMDDYPEVDWIGDIDQWDAVNNGSERYNVMAELRYTGDRGNLLRAYVQWQATGAVSSVHPLYDSFY